MALRFRLAPDRAASGSASKAGEIAPRALRQKWLTQLHAYASQVSAKPHLACTSGDDRRQGPSGDGPGRPDLAAQAAAALQALREAAERTDASW